MNNLITPDSKIIDSIETLIREIKDEYIKITTDTFNLKTSFTLIDRHHRVSFYRPYIIGIENLSKEKIDMNFTNAKKLVNDITQNININPMAVIEIGRKELMGQVKKRWGKEVIFCELSLNAFKKNGFSAEGQPTIGNISHAIVDFNLNSINRSREAEKYMSENDMIIYTSNRIFKNHPKIIYIDV